MADEKGSQYGYRYCGREKTNFVAGGNVDEMRIRRVGAAFGLLATRSQYDPYQRPGTICGVHEGPGLLVVSNGQELLRRNFECTFHRHFLNPFTETVPSVLLGPLGGILLHPCPPPWVFHDEVDLPGICDRLPKK